MFLNHDILQHIFDNLDYFTMLNMLKLNKGLNRFIDTKRLKALATLKKILNRKGIASEKHGSYWWISNGNTFQAGYLGYLLTYNPFDDHDYKKTPQILTGISVFGKDITKITIQAVNWSTLYVFHFVDANYVYINYLDLLLYKLLYANIRIIVESKCTYKVAIHTTKETNCITQDNYIIKWHTHVKIDNNIKQNELVYDTGVCCLRRAR